MELKKKNNLYNGKIIKQKIKIKHIIDFSNLILIKKFNTNSITHPKIQEINTFKIIVCK